MTNQTDWSILHLKGNPFGNTLTANSGNIVWAGMPELKQRFNEIFQEAAFSSTTQVVLNRGHWGGGKTHASLYFGIEDHLPSEVTKQTQVYTINIRSPKEAGNPAKDFYIDFLEKLGMTRVQKIIHNAVSNLSETEVLQSLQTVLESEELARALWLFGTEDTSEKQGLLRNYFFESCTPTDLKKLGVARNISKAQDRFKIIAGVLQCLIGLDANHNLSRPSRVYLWIDEIEDLVFLPSAQFRIISQGLREIIDRLPNFLTLFLNMSLAEPEIHEDFEAILGNAVIDRITHSIYFPELKLDEAVEYVKKLVNHPQYRNKPLPEKLPQTYPFDEIALRMLLENLEKRTPRDINKQCHNAINCAFRDNQFELGKGIIDPEYVMKIQKREIDQEMDQAF